MKKLLRTVLLALALVNAGLAQTNTFPGSGNVGIGTTTPLQKLSVTGGTFNVGAVGDYYGAWLVGGQSTDSYLGLGAWHSQAGYIKWYSTARRLAIYTTSASESLTFQESGGNVGVGTISPSSHLQVEGNNNFGRNALVRATGGYGGGSNSVFFGHGNTEYLATLGANNGNGYPFIAFYAYHGSAWNTLKRASAANLPSRLMVTTSGLLTYDTAASGALDSDIADFTTKFAITNAGNVGIGTTNPTQKLSVNGAIRAKEVIVDTGWADYVFAEGYRLPALSEVEAHIKEHQHLPGIPSANEVAANGISVGEMQAKLLAKIEELTLHQIAQEKQQAEYAQRNTEQAESLKYLTAQNADLQARLARLESRE